MFFWGRIKNQFFPQQFNSKIVEEEMQLAWQCLKLELDIKGREKGMEICLVGDYHGSPQKNPFPNQEWRLFNSNRDLGLTNKCWRKEELFKAEKHK